MSKSFSSRCVGRLRAARLALALTFVVARAAGSQQSLPPTRPIGHTITTSLDSFQSVHDVRQLSDGRVLVNDVAARQLVLLDSALGHPVVVLDTSSANARHYPRGTQTRLLPYLGDSTLFIDIQSLALLVIDPSGTVARVISLPVQRFDLASANTDAAGHLVLELLLPTKPPPPVASIELSVPVRDSEPIVRADLVTHQVDTVAKAALPMSYPSVLASGGPPRPVTTPIRISDGWTVLSDGTVAVVRSQAYQVEWTTMAGTRTSSPKFAHDWFRITDSTKEALLDSLRRADAERDSILQARGMTPVSNRSLYPDVSQLPDYRASFFLRSPFDVSGDADGNLWIHEGLSRINVLGGPPVFDVVSPKAGLFDRVQFPGGTTVVGFGPGVVYLSSRNGTTSSLVRARIH